MSTKAKEESCPHCGKDVDRLTADEMVVCDREVRKMFVKRAFTGTGPNEMFRGGGRGTEQPTKSKGDD